MGIRAKGGMWCPEHGQVLAQANFSAFGSRKDNWRCPHCGGLAWGSVARRIGIAPKPQVEHDSPAPAATPARRECWAPGCVAMIAAGETHYCEAHRRK